jgi:hypothetical protein
LPRFARWPRFALGLSRFARCFSALRAANRQIALRAVNELAALRAVKRQSRFARHRAPRG